MTTVEVPCQSCGKIVVVILPYKGCAFCEDCWEQSRTMGWSMAGTEQFNDERMEVRP